jgi:hypothetical protein
MIHAGAVDQVREKLLENNLEYKVSMEDVQKAIDEENPKPGEDLEGRKGFRLTWNYYHNLDDIYDFLHYLEHTYPKLCTVRTIGGSAEGRPIKLLKISNGRKGNRAVFLEGGIHSREWISPATVTYILYQFVSGYNKETSSMRGLDFYVRAGLEPRRLPLLLQHRQDVEEESVRYQIEGVLGGRPQSELGVRLGQERIVRRPLSQLLQRKKTILRTGDRLRGSLLPRQP